MPNNHVRLPAALMALGAAAITVGLLTIREPTESQLDAKGMDLLTDDALQMTVVAVGLAVAVLGIVLYERAYQAGRRLASKPAPQQRLSRRRSVSDEAEPEPPAGTTA